MIESSSIHSQQDLSTYRGLVPFNFQHLENNLKPFELLIEPSSEETSLSIIMIIKCDQNKCHRKSQAHPPSLIRILFRERTGESIRAMRDLKTAFVWPWRVIREALARQMMK